MDGLAIRKLYGSIKNFMWREYGSSWVVKEMHK